MPLDALSSYVFAEHRDVYGVEAFWLCVGYTLVVSVEECEVDSLAIGEFAVDRCPVLGEGGLLDDDTYRGCQVVMFRLDLLWFAVCLSPMFDLDRSAGCAGVGPVCGLGGMVAVYLGSVSV